MTPRQSRALALALLLLVLALAVAAVAVPLFLLHHHYDDAIDNQLDLQARYTRIGATASGLNERLQTLEEIGTQGFFLKDAAPALAASEVQELVKGVIEREGGRIATMRIQDHKDDGRYRKVAVSVQMNISISAAQKIFYALETRRPYLMLENVSIRAPFSQRAGGMPATGEEFFVQFDVAGYTMTGGRP